MRLDKLLLIGEAVAEAEADRAKRSASGSSTTTLPGGMRELRINHREMEP